MLSERDRWELCCIKCCLKLTIEVKVNRFPWHLAKAAAVNDYKKERYSCPYRFC